MRKIALRIGLLEPYTCGRKTACDYREASSPHDVLNGFRNSVIDFFLIMLC